MGVMSVCNVGVCHSDEGAEHMQGTAAGERRGNIWAESWKEQHQGMCRSVHEQMCGQSVGLY